MAVACARKPKLAAVNVVERYEENVLFNGVSATRDRKYGVAVIRAMEREGVRCKALVASFGRGHAPFHGRSTAQPRTK